jgi:shikimate kinase
VLQKLDEERRPSYAEAHIHVKSGDGAHKDVVEAIVHALEEFVSKR